MSSASTSALAPKAIPDRVFLRGERVLYTIRIDTLSLNGGPGPKRPHLTVRRVELRRGQKLGSLYGWAAVDINRKDEVTQFCPLLNLFRDHDDFYIGTIWRDYVNACVEAGVEPERISENA